MGKRKINWTLQKMKLKELNPYEFNPRKLTEKGMADLKASIDKFGLAEPIIINKNTNIIIGGHARYFTLLKMKEELCDCYVPDKELTEKEMKELNIRLNKNIAGDWDFNILSEAFELPDLMDWGFEKWELGLPAGDIIEKEYIGLPEFNQEDIKPYKALMIYFPTEADLNKFSKIIDQKISDKTKYIWYPRQDFDEMNREKVYIHES